MISREGNPSKKLPTQNKNSLHKQFAQNLSACFLLVLKGKEGTIAQTIPKLFVQAL